MPSTGGEVGQYPCRVERRQNREFSRESCAHRRHSVAVGRIEVAVRACHRVLRGRLGDNSRRMRIVCEPLAAATSAPMVLSFGADVSLVPPVGKEAQERFDKELPHLKITVTPSFVFAGRRGRGHWLFTVTVEQPPPKTDTGFFGKK